MKLAKNIKLNRLLLAAILFASPNEFSARSASDGYAAILEMIADPLGLLSARSPGERGAALIQTKQPYANGDYWGMAPEEGLLPDSVNRSRGISNATDADFTVPLTVDPLPFEGLPLDDLLGLYESSGAAGLPGFVGGGRFPGSFSGGGGVGGGGPPGGPPAAPRHPATQTLTLGEVSVPEPETWLMMIVGFFAVGSALRLKNGKRARIGRG